jgi:hypothetical protein
VTYHAPQTAGGTSNTTLNVRDNSRGVANAVQTLALQGATP